MEEKIENDINIFIEENIEYYKSLIMELAAISAPSFKEDKRVSFISGMLCQMGAISYVDEAKNVIVTDFMKENSSDGVHLYMAHTDIVFSDEEPLPVKADNMKIYGAGVGDDTTNVAALIMVIKYLKEKNIDLQKQIMFAFNTCEEGLGNLRGSRELLKKYENRIIDVISFDLGYDKIICKAVGSKRFRINIKAEGGHSFNDFGNDNAIYYMSKLVETIYNVKVASLEGKNTYNVGLIQGGTSVNTIAENALLLFEYRSDNRSGMKYMEQEFNSVFSEFKKRHKDIKVEIQLIGERPVENGVDNKELDILINNAKTIIEKAAGTVPKLTSGSTDCNTFLAKGIPAICYGTYLGQGEHTREEYVLVDSLKNGLKIALNSIVVM